MLTGSPGEFASTGVSVPVLVGVVLVAAFVRNSLTDPQPLLDLGLLGDRTFALGIGGTMQSAARRQGVAPGADLLRGGAGVGGDGGDRGAGGPGGGGRLAVTASLMVIMPTMTTASRESPKERMGAASTAVSAAGFRTVFLVAAALTAAVVIPAMELSGRRVGSSRVPGPRVGSG